MKKHIMMGVLVNKLFSLIIKFGMVLIGQKDCNPDILHLRCRCKIFLLGVKESKNDCL